jgi:hypothetical protein
LGTCQLILISPTGILIIGWILKHWNSRKNISKKLHPQPIFDTECAIKLQEFEWLFVQCHIPKEASPAWTKAYNCSGFANSEQRLFVVGNYKFYIGTIQGILQPRNIE